MGDFDILDLKNFDLGNSSGHFFAAIVFGIFIYQVIQWISDPQDLGATYLSRLGRVSFFSFGLFSLGGFLVFHWGIEEFSLVFAVALGFGLSILSPTLALCFFIVITLLRPWELHQKDDLLYALPRASGLLAILMFAWGRYSSGKKIAILMNRESLTILIFSLWLFLTGSFSSDPANAQQTFWDSWARTLFVFILMVNVLRTPGHLGVLRVALILTGLAVGSLTILNTLKFGNIRLSSDHRAELQGLLGDSNDVSSFVLMGLPFALAGFFHKGGKLARVGGLFYLFVSLTLVWLAQSRGAILSLFVFGSLIMYDRLKNKRLAIALAGLLAFAAIPAQSLLQRQDGDLEASRESRVIYWKTGLNMALRHPLLGVGYTDYPNQYDNFLTDVSPYETGKRTAHSSWILCLAENGIPGFLLFVSLYVYAVLSALRLRPERPEYFYAVISYGVAMTFLSHTYSPVPYLLFAFTFASDMAFRKANSSERKESLAA